MHLVTVLSKIAKLPNKFLRVSDPENRPYSLEYYIIMLEEIHCGRKTLSLKYAVPTDFSDMN